MPLPPVSHVSIHLDTITEHSVNLTEYGGNYLHISGQHAAGQLLLGGSPEAWERFGRMVAETIGRIQMAAKVAASTPLPLEDTGTNELVADDTEAGAA